MGIPSTPGVVDEKASSLPDDVLPETSDVAHASNGNVIDDGLQRGLKNRHLVGAYLYLIPIHTSTLPKLRVL